MYILALCTDYFETKVTLPGSWVSLVVKLAQIGWLTKLANGMLLYRIALKQECYSECKSGKKTNKDGDVRPTDTYPALHSNHDFART